MKRDFSKPESLRPLSEALEEHSAEGISILTADPWRFTQLLVYTMVGLVLAD